jgi:methyl-accepting chemotaxis protein
LSIEQVSAMTESLASTVEQVFISTEELAPIVERRFTQRFSKITDEATAAGVQRCPDGSVDAFGDSH